MIKPKPRFTVVYTPDVQDGLTEYWLAADSAERRRITRVVDLIDRVLEMAPEQQGDVAPPDTDSRVWEVRELPPPFRVSYQLRVEDRLVRVIGITFFGDEYR